MYDFAGEWIYRVGLPAKSGVGGGILAALPAQFGLGSFSPLLDEHGNSVRGLKVCEVISAHFDLHMLNRTSDVRTCIVADYDFERVSPRGRQPHEQKILDQHRSAVRVLELTGTLTFANVDLIARRIEAKPPPQVLILDFGRVPLMSSGAAKMLADFLSGLKTLGTTPVLSGIGRDSANWSKLAAHLGEDARVHDFTLLDEAIEWAEDQIIYRFGGFTRLMDTIDLAEQELLIGLAPELVEGDRQARLHAPLPDGRAHHPRRRGIDLHILPAKRHGEREACQRRAVGDARAGRRVRRDGFGRGPPQRRCVGRHGGAMHRASA